MSVEGKYLILWIQWDKENEIPSIFFSERKQQNSTKLILVNIYYTKWMLVECVKFYLNIVVLCMCYRFDNILVILMQSLFSLYFTISIIFQQNIFTLA